MAKELKYVEFAKALGIARASVTMAVQNNSINIVDGKKLIDIDDPINRAWIDKQISKGRTWDLNRIYSKEPATAQPVNKSNKSTKPAKPVVDEYQKQLRDLELKKKLEELRRTENTNRMEEIKIRKLQGTLLPIDAVKTVFLFTIENIRSTYLQDVNGLASIFVERLGGEEKHFKELQRTLVEKINDSTKEARDNTIKGLAGIVDEYKETRGRGERK